MSTDSTELTFIRCPSCRSLVPAVSTRCRMCGASLDAAAAQGEGGEPRAAGRVRQRTMSTTPQSEFGQAVDRLRDEVNTGSTEGAASTEYDDPLALYSEQESAPVEDAATTAAVEAGAAAVEGDPDFDQADPLGDYLAGDEAASDGSTDDLDDDEYDPFADSDEDDEEVTAAAKKAATKPTEALPQEPVASAAATQNGQPEGAKPRVIVESGARRFGGAKGGLSFGAKSQSEDRPAQRAQEPRTSEPAKSGKPAREVESAERARPNMETRAEAIRPNETKTREAQPERRRESGVKPAESKSGRLVGWMVSYEDPNGRAIELREGRFFVTASSLKPSDLVLSDPSVSTPHAMVKVTAQAELQIQDLMSDRGVFLREREGAAYQREAEEFTVRNGDWIRFGDVEFLVSLIAHVGEK